MTAETEANKETTEAKPVKKNGGILKYAMIGGGALLVVMLIAFGTVFLLKENPSPPVENENGYTDEVSSETSEEAAPAEEFYEQEEFAAEDPTVIENIMTSLAFLDYEPDAGELVEEEIGMSVEDSIEQVNWLDKEKAALAQREREQDAREKELVLLDKRVTQKLLVLEQVETTRINNLAKLYDGMDSRAVAQLMNNLDDETIVAILPRMKIKNASSVLALIPPKRAAKLSKQMITIAEK